MSRSAIPVLPEALEARVLLSSSIHLSPLGTYRTGLGFDEGAAEIVAHDPETQRLFVINAAASSIDILDLSDPSQPTLIKRVDTSALGSPNSVAVGRNVVAVAIEDENQQAPGKVAFYKTNGDLINSVHVGALPDMITFSPDGRYVLTANEGQPSDDYKVDPEGSVSIIRVPNGVGNVAKLKDPDVRTASFTKYNGQEAALRAQGIRIYGPGSSAAQDFEPEYIGISEDSRTAYVTLQENNAIAVIDIAGANVTKLLPLGFKNHNVPATTRTFTFENLPTLGTTEAGQQLRLGGFSGLFFEGKAQNGNLRFITHTDRGPNGEPTGINRPFLLPDFTPEVIRFELNPGTAALTLTQRIPLKRADGSPLTGLPNTAISSDANQPYNDERGVDLFGQPTGTDALGGDFEGIVVDPTDGSFWMADEYRPAIYHFDGTGKLIERFEPKGTAAAAAQPEGTFGTEALPAVLGQRRQNRGFEAIALQGGKVYAFVQSPIRNPASLSNAALNAMRNIRVVELDPATRATKQFMYIMDNPAPVSADDTRADKIGDAVALPGGGFLALERDDAIDSDPQPTITKKVYGFSLAGATDITGKDTLYTVTRNGQEVSVSLDQMTAAELRTAAGVTAITKTLRVDLAQTGYNTMEKVEGLAVIDANTIALVNDNDFGVAGITIDSQTGTFTLNPGYVPEPVLLGLVTIHGIDASDRDGFINMRNWPVRGMYQPDTVAAYTVNGKTYLLTANEGDARGYAALNEEVRVGASVYKLDPEKFPNAAELKLNNNLGRLTVTNQTGDTDGDGDFDEIHVFGARSFSIFSDDGALVYDSGEEFERITADVLPDVFNASNANNNFDDRSDNKGPEPEGAELGVIDDRTYAFVGLERIGGVMVYDVSDPAKPVFVQYINNRDFTKDPEDQTTEAGDLGPEGLHFISAEDSPTGQPLLAVANEVSGTVTVYAIVVTPPAGAAPAATPHTVHRVFSDQSIFGRIKDRDGWALENGNELF